MYCQLSQDRLFEANLRETGFANLQNRIENVAIQATTGCAQGLCWRYFELNEKFNMATIYFSH